MKVINITKHEMVPKQTLLNDKEKEEVLKRYEITLRQLPRISLTDPVIKLMEAKVGDVVRIQRKSETAGQTTYYRVVVRG